MIGRCLLQHLLGRQVSKSDVTMIAFEESRRRPGGWCMQIWPPGHKKTTTLSVGGTLYDLVYDTFCGDRNIALAIASRVDMVAAGVSDECRGHIERNERFREVFGDLVGDKWGTTAWNVKGRKSYAKETSVTCVSIKGQVFSWHYDVIRCDDLIQEEDANTATQRKATYANFFAKLASRPKVGGMIFINGLHVNPYDLHVDLRNDPRLIDNCLVVSALPEKGSWARENLGAVPWGVDEGGYDILHFMQEKQAMGSARFGAQYIGDPKSMEGRILNLSLVRRYTPEMIRPEKLAQMLVVNAADLAISDAPDADEFAMSSIAVDVNGNILVLGDFGEKGMPFHLQIENIHEWDKRRKPRTTFIEVNGVQRVWKQEAYRKYRMNLTAICHSKSKTVRGYDFQPIVECGQLWLPETGMPELEEQIRDFDGLEGHPDDRIDALMTAWEGSKLLSFPGGN